MAQFDSSELDVLAEALDRYRRRLRKHKRALTSFRRELRACDPGHPLIVKVTHKLNVIRTDGRVLNAIEEKLFNAKEVQLC